MKVQIILLVLGLFFLNCEKTFEKDEESLKAVFKDYFLVGTALNPDHVSGKDPGNTFLIKKHFNSVTAENVFKWEHIHPYPGKYDFGLQDEFVSFGERENMFLVGHVLLWHQQTPDWVFVDEQEQQLNREELLNTLREHINTVAGRYKGRINGWDVVNEAVDEDGTLRESEWLKIIGEDYIAKAFQFAREADPGAELYYNDYSLENEQKRNGAIKLLRDLKEHGIKVDGVGLQGHYKMDWPSVQQLDSTIRAFADLGLKIHITELDVDVLPYDPLNPTADISLNIEYKDKFDPYSDGMPDSAQKNLADRYAELFNVFLSNHETVERVTFWGVTDKESWLNNWPVRGRKNYPLLFDREGKPKEAFYAVLNTAKDN